MTGCAPKGALSLHTPPFVLPLSVLSYILYSPLIPLPLRSLYPPGTGQEAPEDLKFKLMVAVNKCDLLPSQATQARVNVSPSIMKEAVTL